MRLTKFIAATALLSSFAAASVQASPNLTVNGSFETGNFAGWSQFGNTGFTGVTGNFIGVNPTDGAFQGFFGPVGSTGGITQSIATLTGSQYRVSFDLHHFGGGTNSFNADFGGSLLSFNNDAGFNYTSFSFLVTAGLPATALTFTFRQDPSYYLLDNVSVEEVPEPATIALIGIALLSLFGFGHLRGRAEV